MKSTNYWTNTERVTHYIIQRKQDANEHSPSEQLIRWIDDAVSKGTSLQQGSLVDVGSGPGTIAGRLIKKHCFKKYLAIDISKSMLDTIPTYVDVDDVETTFQLDDASRCRFAAEDDSVDLAICIASMPLFPSIENFFTESARILKPGGLFGVSLFVHEQNELGRILCEESVNPMDVYATSKYSLWQYMKMHNFSYVMAGSSLPIYDMGSVPVTLDAVLFKKN